MTIKYNKKLYGLSSTGKIKQWEVSVVQHDNFSEIIVDHGYLDGKIVSSSREIGAGKNIGKANETTHFQQAMLEALSLVAAKLDKQYVENLDHIKKPSEAYIPLPMLAHEYLKRKKYLTYPCYGQPKLNGVRCLVVKLNGQCVAYSRGGKQYKTITKILDYCNKIMKDGDIIDGELFTKSLTFQEIVSCIKSEKELDPNINLMQYWVYDYNSELNYSDRYEYLKSIIKPADDSPLVLVNSTELYSEKEIYNFMISAMQDGYEGAMLRNKTGPYVLKNRSNNLLKYKQFMEKEFLIVGGEESDGLAKGQCVLVCKLNETDNKTFKVRCIGPNSLREEQWRNLKDYIGKFLTVRYQTVSDDGIPIFPIGIIVRDYE